MTSRFRRSRIAASLGLAAGGFLLLLCSAAAAKPARSEAGSGQQFDAQWTDLEKGDADAARALLQLSAQPKDAVAFLARKLRPLKIDAKEVNRLLAQLGSNDEAVWKKAFEELEYFDPRLAIDLETLMNTVTEAPARQRMVEVLSGRPAESLAGQQVNLRAIGQGEGYNFVAQGSWWAEHKVARINSTGWGNTRTKWTRCVRALMLLEHVGTPEAVAVLRAMAQGHPDAQPTRVAKEALQRIAGKSR